jgi:hypothetical protein
LSLLLSGAEAGHEHAISYIEKNQVALEFPWHWQAFADLGTERNSLGMGVGPIPYSAIRAYAREWRMSPIETELLHYVIRALDNHILTKLAKAQSKGK